MACDFAFSANAVSLGTSRNRFPLLRSSLVSVIMPANPCPTLYVRPGCTDCLRSIVLLDRNGIDYELFDISRRDPPASVYTEGEAETNMPALDWHGKILLRLTATSLTHFLRSRQIDVPHADHGGDLSPHRHSCRG